MDVAKGARGVRGGRRPGVLLPGESAGGERSPEHLFALLHALRPAAWLRRAPGRETFPWPGRPDLVVKRSAPAGPGRAPGAPHARASEREAANLLGLARAGLAVPALLAWAADRRADRGALVMRRVEAPPGAAHDAAEELERAAPGDVSALLDEVASLAARLHAAGWHHRDLYLHHLLRGERGLVLVDVGRARRPWLLRERWLVKDLAALASTLPERRRDEDTRALVLAWGRHAGRGGLARMLRRVVAKRERLLSHRPRHVEPGGRLARSRAASTDSLPCANRSATS